MGRPTEVTGTVNLAGTQGMWNRMNDCADKSFFLTSPKQGFVSSCYMKGVAWFWGEEIMGNPISNIDQA